MDHFFAWDDEWNAGNTFESVPEEPTVVHEQIENIAVKEHQVEAVEAVPVQHVEQPTQGWFGGDDEWGSSSYPIATQPELEPVVQQPVREPVREPIREPKPEPVPEPKVTLVSKVVAPQRRVAPQPRTNSWNKEPSTSLFAASATTNKPKQTKQKKAVKPPQKQTQKRSEEKKRQPTKNVISKVAPKKPAKPVMAAPKGTELVVAENQTLRQEVSDLRGQLEQMNTRLMHLEHSKHLLYNSVCTLNSSGQTYEDRVCWTNEHGGDILPAQRMAYELTNDGTGVTIMRDGLYEITFNTFGAEPKIQINNETYATGHTNNSSCYLSICVYVAEQPVITCHVENPVKGNACDHWLCIRRFPS